LTKYYDAWYKLIVNVYSFQSDYCKQRFDSIYVHMIRKICKRYYLMSVTKLNLMNFPITNELGKTLAYISERARGQMIFNTNCKRLYF